MILIAGIHRCSEIMFLHPSSYPSFFFVPYLLYYSCSVLLYSSPITAFIVGKFLKAVSTAFWNFFRIFRKFQEFFRKFPEFFLFCEICDYRSSIKTPFPKNQLFRLYYDISLDLWKHFFGFFLELSEFFRNFFKDFWNLFGIFFPFKNFPKFQNFIPKPWFQLNAKYSPLKTIKQW